jgi:hypothetical protein
MLCYLAEAGRWRLLKTGGRNDHHARDFLGDWRGHLMVDDYSGYKPLFTKASGGNACTELACLAHVRRKFFDLYQANRSPMTYAALEQIADLYEIESQVCQSTPNNFQRSTSKSFHLI